MIKRLQTEKNNTHKRARIHRHSLLTKARHFAVLTAAIGIADTRRLCKLARRTAHRVDRRVPDTVHLVPRASHIALRRASRLRGLIPTQSLPRLIPRDTRRAAVRRPTFARQRVHSFLTLRLRRSAPRTFTRTVAEALHLTRSLTLCLALASTVLPLSSHRFAYKRRRRVRRTPTRARLLIKHVPPFTFSGRVIGTLTATRPRVPQLRRRAAFHRTAAGGTITGTLADIKEVAGVLPSADRSVGLPASMHCRDHIGAFTAAVVKVVAFRKALQSAARTRSQSGARRVVIVGAVHVAADARKANGKVLVDKGTVSRGISGEAELANTGSAVDVGSSSFARILAATGCLDITGQFRSDQGIPARAHRVTVHPEIMSIGAHNLRLITRVLPANDGAVVVIGTFQRGVLALIRALTQDGTRSVARALAIQTEAVNHFTEHHHRLRGRHHHWSGRIGILSIAGGRTRAHVLTFASHLVEHHGHCARRRAITRSVRRVHQLIAHTLPQCGIAGAIGADDSAHVAIAEAADFAGGTLAATVAFIGPGIEINSVWRQTVDGMGTATIASAEEVTLRIEYGVHSDLAWLVAGSLVAAGAGLTMYSAEQQNGYCRCNANHG